MPLRAKRARLGFLALFAAAWAACGSDTRETSVDVVVTDVEPGLAGQIDRIEISMAPAGGEGADRPDVHVFEPAVQGPRLRPVSVRFRPLRATDAGSRLYAFLAVGLRDGAPYVASRQRLVFVAGAQLTLPMRLYPACAGVSCGETETCDHDGRCVDAFVPACGLVPGGARSGCDDVPDPRPDSGPDAALEAGTRVDLGPMLDLGPRPEVDSGVDAALDAGPPPPPEDAGPPVECVLDSDCARAIDCVVGRCTAGTCSFFRDDARCDDSNPCTDDSCGDGGCVATPNAETCDDGVFCNGPDTCSGGACAAHAGDPCAGESVCDEGAETCTGCRDSGDCPARLEGPWSDCGSFADACATAGSRTRTVSTFVCRAGTCERSEAGEVEACARTTDGTACPDDGNGCTDDRCGGGACAHPVVVGGSCAGGYCGASGACVECLMDAHCRDDDRCTLDRCGAISGRCEHEPADATGSFRTAWGTDGFCSETGTMGYQRVEAACYHEAEPQEITRGFVAFDTTGIPRGVLVASAQVRACRTGGPGAQEAELYASAPYPIPLACGGAWSAVVGAREAVIPNGDGPVTLGVSAASVTVDGWSHYQVRYPVTACDPGTWYGKRYTSSTGPGDGSACPDGTPWELSVTWCTAPH